MKPVSFEPNHRFAVVEVCGQTALYEDCRIAPIPGAYVYDVREGEDEYWCTLEPHVWVNHSGCVITREPIDFGDEGRIEFDDDNYMSDTGETMTLAEFLKPKTKGEL